MYHNFIFALSWTLAHSLQLLLKVVKLLIQNYVLLKKATVLEKRPVWFVLTGMGSQWPAMGKDMMEIEVFRKSIMEADEVLKPYGVHLYENLISDGKQFDKVVNSTTGVISVQVKEVYRCKYFG